MPTVPVFTNDVRAIPAPAALANPAAFGAPGDALARGGQQLSDIFGDLGSRYVEARRAIDAANIATTAEQQLGNSAAKWRTVPDRQQALAGFSSDADNIRKQLVDKIQDPQVQEMVTRQFGISQVTNAENVRNESFRLEGQKSVGDLDLQLNDLAHSYAQATDDFGRAHIVDTAQLAIKSRELAGYLPGDAAARALIQFRSRADEADAQRLINADPRAALAKLGTDFGNLDEYTRERLTARAENKASRAAAADAIKDISADPRAALAKLDSEDNYQDLDAETRAHLSDYAKEKASRADETLVLSDMLKDPRGTYAKLEGGSANYPWLDEMTRDRLVSQAENKVREQDASQRGVLRSQFEDNLASIERTGKPVAPMNSGQWQNVFGPDAADEMNRQVQLSLGLFHAKQATALSSPQEDQALLQKWEPRGGGYVDQERAQEALRKTLDAKYRAIASDRAAYVMQAAPSVQAAFAAAQKDPKQYGRAISMLDSAYDQLGVPMDNRNIFTADAARQLARKVEGDPEHVPQTLKDMQTQFGTAWPRVWSDMTGLGKLPATFQAVPVLDNQRDGALLARWLGQAPKKEMVGELLGPKVENDIRANVRSDPGVQSLLSSLSRSGSSLAQTDGVLDSIDSLAFAKSYFDRDPKAAENAIASFTGKYEFMPNGGARVPRDRFPDVQANAAALLHGLSADNVQIPDVYGRPGAPKPDEFLDLLKASPTWITSPKADALWLMDHSGRVVRDKKGAPVAVPFNMPAAHDARTDGSLWQRFLGAVGLGGSQ